MLASQAGQFLLRDGSVYMFSIPGPQPENTNNSPTPAPTLVIWQHKYYHTFKLQGSAIPNWESLL